MDLKYRRILYIFFILAFFMITPLVWLYASGYSLTGGFKLEKTGILILDSKPKGAKIFLNDKLQKKFLNKIISNNNYIGTPAKIKNLKPGEYEVRLELENYWPWQKKLKIKPGQSTFAEDIILFKKSTPLKIIDNCEKDFQISPDENYLIGVSKNVAILYNLETKNKTLFLASKNIQLGKAQWSKNNKKLITQNYIFDINNWENAINIKQVINGENLKWKDDDNFYYLYKKKLYSYNLNQKTVKNEINDTQINDYIIHNNNLYLIETDILSKKIFLSKRQNNKNKKIMELQRGTYKFTNSKKFINILDIYAKKLYIIDPDLPFKNLRKTIYNVEKNYWIDGNKLLYANKYEIYIFDIKSGNDILLTRISQEIQDILWHPSNNYIIYSTENNINILELDSREKRNITKILEAKNISDLKLNKDGKIIYFFANIKNKKAIYQLGL